MAFSWNNSVGIKKYKGTLKQSSVDMELKRWLNLFFGNRFLPPDCQIKLSETQKKWNATITQQNITVCNFRDNMFNNP